VVPIMLSMFFDNWVTTKSEGESAPVCKTREQSQGSRGGNEGMVAVAKPKRRANPTAKMTDGEGFVYYALREHDVRLR